MQALYLMKQIYSRLLGTQKSNFMIVVLFILFINSASYGSTQLEIVDPNNEHKTHQTIDNYDFISSEYELRIREKISFKAPNIELPIISKADSIGTTLSYNPSNEIIISGNADFHSQASSKGWDADGRDGSASNPYLIYNLDVTPTTSNLDAINIIDTDVYFNISSCLLHSGRWGIYFNNVTHGIIHNNIIKDNNEEGIKAEYSPNNSYLLNTVHNSSVIGEGGIYLNYAENSTLLFNTVHNNSNDGIRLHYSGNSTLLNNLVYENYQHGLNLVNSHNCTGADNIIYNNEIVGPYYGGISLYNCSYSIIRDNTIFNEPFNGLKADNSYGCKISNITAINNGYRGLEVNDCPNSTFSDIKSYNNNYTGILISYSENSSFTNLSSVNNSYKGINIEYSGNSQIKNVYCDNNTGIGFFFSYSNNSLLVNITSISNGEVMYGENSGVEMRYSSYCTIMNISSSYNANNGLTLVNSSHSTIENSYFYNNSGYGFFLEASHYNEFDGNYIYNNSCEGSYLASWTGGNHYNIFSNNYIFKNQHDGLYLQNSNYNQIVSNVIYDNLGDGIDFSSSLGVNISSNIIYHNQYRGVYGFYDNEVQEGAKNTITNNDLINNIFETEISYQINIDGDLDVWDVHNNFYDTHRVPDEDDDGIVDYPYIIGEYWDDEHSFVYDYNPETEPINSPSIHYLSTPVLLFPTAWDPNNPDIWWEEYLINGTVSIEFLAPIDSYSHSVTYSLYYVHGWDWSWNLQNWTLLASGISVTMYSWDTTTVPDGNIHLAVAATCSDGLRSIYIDRSSFKIDNAPPELTNIVSSPFPTVYFILTSFLVLVLLHRKKNRVKE